MIVWGTIIVISTEAQNLFFYPHRYGFFLSFGAIRPQQKTYNAVKVSGKVKYDWFRPNPTSLSMCNYVAKYENTPQDKGEEVPFNLF